MQAAAGKKQKATRTRTKPCHGFKRIFCDVTLLPVIVRSIRSDRAFYNQFALAGKIGRGGNASWKVQLQAMVKNGIFDFCPDGNKLGSS